MCLFLFLVCCVNTISLTLGSSTLTHTCVRACKNTHTDMYICMYVPIDVYTYSVTTIVLFYNCCC
jgi:hypothetical protein